MGKTKRPRAKIVDWKPLWLRQITGHDIETARRGRVLIGFNETDEKGRTRTKLFKRTARRI